jgi:1-phosphofructokinase family hexose kinase
VIVAAGLSPAWQQILTVDSLRLDEVNRTRASQWCASGKVLNVGIALAQLRAEAITIAPIGGPAREPIAAEFKALGAQGEWVHVEEPTRVCTTLLEQSTGRTTELVVPASKLNSVELSRFEATCVNWIPKASVVVFTGSIPAETPANIYRSLLEKFSGSAILDIRGPELQEALRCKPLVVKPNHEELGQTLGTEIANADQLRAAMNELRQRGAQWVVVTQGAGDVWASGSEGTYRLTPPKVSVVNPIGCGDCLAAAMAWRLDLGESVLDSLRAGIAAAAINAQSLLPARFDPQMVLTLARSVTIQKT